MKTAQIFRIAFFSAMLIPLVACSEEKSPPPNDGHNETIVVNETLVSTDTIAEPIYLNNCGSTANAEQISERSQTITIEGQVEIGIGYQILEASVGAKYSVTKGVVKSHKVIAAPGTNMEFVLLWTEKLSEGIVTVSGKSGEASYRVSVPISVEQTSAKDLGCQDVNFTTTANNPIILTPTPIVVLATEPPFGSAIIGALNNDGTAAIDTSNIGLHPRRHLDAAGKMRAIYEDHIWVIPESGTGIAYFYNIEPGEYVVCFGQYGSWIKVGEITVEANITIQHIFRWPPSYNVGSSCDLN